MPSAPSTEMPLPGKSKVDDVAMLDLSESSEEDMEYARKVLGETDDSRTRCLQELKDMIFERGEVKPYRMDDPFLLRFLRARSFHVERAHRLLTRYTRFKEENPTFQKDVDPESLCRVLGEDDVITVMPFLDQFGRRILVFRVGNWDPSKVPITDLFRATLIILELGIMEQRSQIRGGVVIFDLEGIGLHHAWQMTPSIATKVIQLLETCSPMKTMGIHVLNESWVFDIIYGLFSPILADTAVDKLFFHGSDLASLHEHIDPKHLPKKYGGSRDEVDYTVWLEALKSKNVFRRELKNLGYKIDEDPAYEEY